MSICPIKVAGFEVGEVKWKDDPHHISTIFSSSWLGVPWNPSFQAESAFAYVLHCECIVTREDCPALSICGMLLGLLEFLNIVF